MINYLLTDEVVNHSADLQERLLNVVETTNLLQEEFKEHLDKYGLKKEEFLKTQEKHSKLRATVAEAEEMNLEIQDENKRLGNQVDNWTEVVGGYIDKTDQSAEDVVDDLGKLKRKKIRLE